jgi:alkanesulfonate monooxygenase SsuD/methylene tetrahydromethanopterin reductase-like flavin-dependent oxidoreductase (luciferase family)
MQPGVVFPQTEIGADPAAIRAYVQAVQDLGYRHLMVYDHVLGADPTAYPGWSGPYTCHSLFHEPMVLFGYLAAMAPELELVTGVIILPQRQTVLAAKQAAEVDVLTGGKFRMGIGIGWNPVEYEGLGTNFHDRGSSLRGADRRPAAAVDGASAQLRRPLSQDHRRRTQPATDPATDSALDR